ncbi:MAG: S8 family peptidase [candidate division WOR-3 bacterium]
MISLVLSAVLSPGLSNLVGSDSIRCFVVSDLPATALFSKGIRVTGGKRPYYTAWVKSGLLSALRDDPLVSYIQEARPVSPLNDLAGPWSVSYYLVPPDTIDFTAGGQDTLQIIATYDPAGDLDPQVELFDGDWVLLASDQDGGWGRAARLETRLPGPGDYHIVITPESGSGAARVYLLSGAPLVLPDASYVHLGTGAWAQRSKGFTGKGVVVGMVDSGLDWDHPDFWPSATDTRIMRMWDQTLIPEGGEESPPDFGYGVEYDSLDVVSGTPRTIDEMGHGTHVMGIAAGDGSATNGLEPAGRYAGLAPDAYIISVKTTWLDADVVDGVDYIFRRAESLGLPCVVNLSLGSHYGPHDGTGPFEAAIANLTGPGRIVVGAAGNSGNDPLHARVVVSGTDSISFQAPGSLYEALFFHTGGDEYRMRFTPPAPSSLQDWEYDPGSGSWETVVGGPYRPNLTCFIASPGIDLSGAISPVLIVVHSYAMGQGDGAIVEASRDGEVWEKIFPSDGYSGSTGYEPAFTGGSGGTTEDTFDLSGYAGGNIRIRFRVFSDGSGVSDGWKIDSILVSDDGTPIFSEGFSSGDGGFSPGIVNFLIARPGTSTGAWVGAGASDGGGYLRVFYSGIPYPGNGCLFGEWAVEGPTGPPVYTWGLVLERETAGGDGQFDAWRYGYGGAFIRGMTLGGTMVEPACSPRILAVGAYGARTGWESSEGVHYDNMIYAQVPGIRPWSSKGPTRDNRIKPDAVGASLVISTASRDCSWPAYQLSLDGYHAFMAGTSMSAPQGTGAVALLLEAQPGLGPDEVISLFRDWANQDTITGFVPDTVWGWGRLSVPDTSFLRIREGAHSPNPQPCLRVLSSVGPRPWVYYSVQAGDFSVELYDIAGRRVKTLASGRGPSEGNLAVEGYPSGVYVILLRTRGAPAMRQKVVILR